MTDTLVNFQGAPASGALTTLYTAPVGQLGVIIDSISICNTSGQLQTCRLTLSSGGIQDVSSATMYNYLPIQSNDTFERTAAIALMPGDQIRAIVSASGAVSIQGYGVAFS